MKPSGYFRHFRSAISEIRETIAYRSERGRWRPDLPRSRQRQWWLRLGRMIRLFLGVSCSLLFPQAFTLLMEHNIIPVTSAGKKENQVVK